MKQEKNVDIVIPIYNAYEFTKKCIETVIHNTDLEKHTLVLINDKSPDEKILPMLKEFKNNHPELNIDIIDSEQNLGFVKSVNIGMKHSNNDVILLNSDTEVTLNWLDKMQYVAYVKENVATVTPLSNNATLASVPNFLEENTLPDYLTLEEYAQTIEECSFNSYPELTTAHGFCMYIRRDAIEKVGLFDDVTFEKGYGEENDFSFRCIKCGLINLLCDNTFIYHKGTQSFTEKKKALIDSHLQLLASKHPKNFEMNTWMCMNNPYQYIQDNVKYSIGNKYRKNVLIVAHEFMKKERKLLGGTVLHIYDLIENLREKVNFHVFFKEDGKYRLRSFFENSESEIILGEVSSFEFVMTYNYEYRKIVEKLFNYVNIDFVHVHHIMNQYFDMFDVIKEKNIPYIVSLHDFYFICPTFALLENDEKYCGDNEKRDCLNCLKKIKNIDGEFIETWRNIAYDALKDAKQLIAPTKSTMNIYNHHFKNLNIKVIEHGVDLAKYEYENIQNADRKKNIAFMGGINKKKGLEFFRKLIDEVNKEDCRYNLHLFGSTCEDELNKSNGNYIYHGNYNREDIIKNLKENHIDIILLLAIWPETYSYTLTEASIAEIPVIALDYGALAERISKDDLGWILGKETTFDDVLNKLNAIFENENEYNQKIQNLKKYVKDLKSIKNMCNDYEKIYDNYLKNSNQKLDNIHKNDFKEMLQYSKRITQQENKINDLYKTIEDYHYTVCEYKKEINRLNENIENYKMIEEKYNHLISSRKLALLKKIKFIEY